MVRCEHLWGLPCPLCSDIELDPLGHHAATCRRGGNVVSPPCNLRDAFVEFCHQAHLSVKVEGGNGLKSDTCMSYSQPADVLVRDWAQDKPAAFDIMVTSPLSPAILAETSQRLGAAAEAAERRKHAANNPRCAELGWVCVPLAVATYCNWGEEARQAFTVLAPRLTLDSSSHYKAS